MRKTFFVTCLFLAALAAHGQQPLVEKIDVNLVNVDVTVTSHGAPARGLTRDDFEVREDGVLQTITNFDAVETTPVQVAISHGGTMAATTASPAAALTPDDRFRRKTLLIVDYAHTSKVNRNRALQRLEEFIDDPSTAVNDWSIAVAASDIKIVLPLTSDKKRIHACIEAMRNDATWRPVAGGPAVTLDMRLPHMDPAEAAADSTYTSVAFRAVRDGARAFAGAEGKKIILLISAGFGDLNVPSSLGSRHGGKILTLRDELIHEVNASNLSFYILDPEGMGMNTAGSLYWMARETGGRFMGDNFPERALRQFEELSSNFYSLAYRPQHPEDSKYHHITVRLKKAGSYKLQYRDGYGSLPIELQLERTLSSASGATMQASVLPLSVTAGEPRADGKKLLMNVAIAVPLKNLEFVPSREGSDARVNLFVSVFDAAGHNLGIQRFVTSAHAKRDETTDHGDLIQNATLRLTKGTGHTIVVAVHDQVTDAVGVARQHLEF
jgi:VWFA-related protein